MTWVGPTGRFAPDFGDIRKVMFTKFCDKSSQNQPNFTEISVLIK